MTPPNIEIPPREIQATMQVNYIQGVQHAVIVDDKWVVINVKDKSTVVDADFYESTFKTSKMNCNKAGYVHCSGNMTYVHQVVTPNEANDPSLSVDHINRITVDNRLCNLRLATVGEQNANKFQRCDKIPPVSNLIERGITYHPRGIRYDAGMERYVIEHSATKRLTTPTNLTGTRSTKMDHVAKFKDTLELYITILSEDKVFMEDDLPFAAYRKSLAEEYMAIMDAARAFDHEINPGAVVNIDELGDDLTYAKDLMKLLTDVTVQKGPANIPWTEKFTPYGVPDTVARIKGDTMTLYDANMHSQLSSLNWETSGSVPRYKKRSLISYIWTDIMKRTIPEGHIVAQFSCDGYDVRKANLYILERTMAFRVNPNEWVVPDGVDIGMHFLPRGIMVNSSKVMIGQSGQLVPNSFGADAEGLYIKTRNRANTNTEALIKNAIKVLIDTHGLERFKESNDNYQYLMRTFRQASGASHNEVFSDVEKLVKEVAEKLVVADKPLVEVEVATTTAAEAEDTHHYKISVAHRKNKLETRKITDDVIDQIKAARANCEKLADIATKFGYAHQYISDICRGVVLKSDEQLDPVKIAEHLAARKAKRAEGPVSDEERLIRNGIARRKNTPSQIIAAMREHRANPKLPYTVLAANHDMRYNQVRDACVGNTKLYEREFPIDGVTWDEYQGWF